MGTLKKLGPVEAVTDAIARAGVGGRRRRHPHRRVEPRVPGRACGSTALRAAAPGARFSGAQPGRPHEVVPRQRDRVRRRPRTSSSWRTVPTRLFPTAPSGASGSSPTATGTRIVQTFEVLKLNPLMDRLIYLVPAHRDRLPALTEDLRRLGQVAAASAARADVPFGRARGPAPSCPRYVPLRYISRT